MVLRAVEQMSRGLKNSPQRCIEGAVSPGSKVLIAVSGGVDSVCLLHAVCSLRETLGLHIEIAHLDHGVRETSSRDALFVESLATHHGCPFHLATRAGPPAGENMEAWGRRERYRFFSSILSSRGLDWVLTAHNANDAAETLVMRFFSNKALSGISERDEERRCLRPFLTLSRGAIEEYARLHHLEWMEDESNADQRYLRNKIRHKLLPLLQQEFYSRITEVLAERAGEFAEDEDALRAGAEPLFAQLDGFRFGEKQWFRALRVGLPLYHPAVRWRIIEELLAPHLGFTIGRAHAQRVLSFIEEERTGIQLPGGFSLHRKNGGIAVSRTADASSD